jgi:hypothetical protein
MNGNRDLFGQPPAGVGSQGVKLFEDVFGSGAAVTSPQWKEVGSTSLNAVPPRVPAHPVTNQTDVVPGDVGSFSQHD